MLQKYRFQSLVVALASFPVVRRIQVEQGHGFRVAPDIHGVSLQSLDSQGSRLLCPIGIDFNAVAMSLHILKQMSKCHTITDTGIERGEGLGKGQSILESFRLGNRKREKA